jgi:hypothetical protein
VRALLARAFAGLGVQVARMNVGYSLPVVVGITRSVPELGSEDCVAGSKRVG